MTATPWPWPAQVDDGGAAHLEPDLPMPSVRLASTLGVPVDLSRVMGLACVFVYPWTGRPGLANPPGWDDIPGAHGSTPELEAVRDLYAGFVMADAAVFALSGQDPSHQAELAGRLGLRFALLSDERFAFADALKLPRFEAGGVRYLARLTLLVENGVLVRAFYPAHPPPQHPADVLAWLKANIPPTP